VWHLVSVRLQQSSPGVLAGYGRCTGYLWGPLVHGKMLRLEELKPCEACHDLHNVWRFLCVNCRGDRPRAHGDFRQCITGYCPATEVVAHGEDWGTGWLHTPSWAAHSGYDPTRYSHQDRVVEFLRYHPDPKGSMAALRRATRAARVARDLTGEEPALAYGAGQGGRGQLANLV
jgi:hypothetical protein